MANETVSPNVDIETIELDILKWAAFCSDTKNSIEDCKTKTIEIYDKVSSVDADINQLNVTLPSYIDTIIFNRKSDKEFIDMIWSLKVKDFDKSIISRLTSFIDTNNKNEIEKYFDEYENRYGDNDIDFLTTRLRYYLLPDNYESNKDKIDVIMSKLN